MVAPLVAGLWCRALPRRASGFLAAGWSTHSAPQMKCWRLSRHLRHSATAFYSTLVPSNDVTVYYKHGLPVINVLLPSRKERCQFTVKPMIMTVGSFLQDIQKEDKGIDTAAICSTEGARFASNTLMEVVLRNRFTLLINNTTFEVEPPIVDKVSSERASELDGIKSLVHSLYTALHLESHQIKQERELLQKLDNLQEQLQPFERMKFGLLQNAQAKTTRLMWVGLALLSTQGGALAWLTWWVYSWDIMEPVTYFITYGSAISFYAYFVLTRQDYVYPEIKDRQFLNYFYKKARKQRFDVEEYNKLKEDLARVEASLRRLRDPLKLKLPIQQLNADH
ncbi:calcium uniporter regulatory subunit MCUb, mitochondrial isoform X2 [Ambystoma mexicanum]|uniref:calcium uniporter regulatory subunit MCUb, mitochondrial isoform X2 n=1 Tax=Ambystoma mexicanum TaxID=8296 RepID=UPI0037E86F9B